MPILLKKLSNVLEAVRVFSGQLGTNICKNLVKLICYANFNYHVVSVEYKYNDKIFI